MTDAETPRRRVVLRYEDRWDELQEQLAVDRAAGLVPSAVRDAFAAWFDAGSMVEVGTLVRRAASSYRGGDDPASAGGADVPADGLIAGWGRLGGTLVFVAADDAALGGGGRGVAASAKAARMRGHALEQAAPLVEVFAAGRAGLDEPDGAAFVRTGYGLDLDGDHELAERSLRIVIVTGPLDEQAAFEAVAAHLVVLAGPRASLFGAAGDTAAALGLADLMVADLPDALRVAGEALRHLPPSRFDPPPSAGAASGASAGAVSGASAGAVSGASAGAVSGASAGAASGARSVPELLDAGWSVEFTPGAGVGLRTVVGLLGGMPVGLAVAGGELVVDAAAANRLCRLVRFCDVFRLPLVIEHAGLTRPAVPTRADVDAHGRLRALLAGSSGPLSEVAHGGVAVGRELGVRPWWSTVVGPAPAAVPSGPVDARLQPAALRSALAEALAAMAVTRPRRDEDERVRFRAPRTLAPS